MLVFKTETVSRIAVGDNKTPQVLLHIGLLQLSLTDAENIVQKLKNKE